jgi:hypothetical protein
MTEQTPVPASQPTGERRGGASGTAVLGAILIAVGIIYLAGQLLDLRIGAELWPLYILGAGVVLLGLGLTQPHGVGLAIAGSIVGLVGLVLFYQEWADHYESWAYAWALVAPGGSGLGMLLHGTRFRNGRVARDGFWQVATGLAIFVVGFVFFEGVIGLSGDRWDLPDWFMPALIIALGVAVLLRALTSGRAEVGPGPGDPSSG